MKGSLNTFKAINGLQSGKGSLGNSVLGDCLVLIRYDLMKNVPGSQCSAFQEGDLIFPEQEPHETAEESALSPLFWLLLPCAAQTVREVLAAAQPVLAMCMYPIPTR